MVHLSINPKLAPNYSGKVELYEIMGYGDTRCGNNIPVALPRELSTPRSISGEYAPPLSFRCLTWGLPTIPLNEGVRNGENRPIQPKMCMTIISLQCLL